MKIWMWFVIGTVLFWGMYVPTIHKGQHGFGSMNSAIRAFLFVGLAYFVMSLIVLGYAMASGVEPMAFTARGVGISFLAGIFGALGALGIVFAIKNGGKPLIVAPLVFAGAPIMSTFVAMLLDRPARAPGALFYAGIVLAAVGAFLVLRYRPAAGPVALPHAAVPAAPVATGDLTAAGLPGDPLQTDEG